MTRKQLLANGWTIDSHCYPNVAYKGPRFKPTEIKEVPTEKEEKLMKQAKK